MHRTLFASLMLSSLVALAPLTVAADTGGLSLVASFNPAAGELPESVTADAQGNFYLSMGHAVHKLTPDGVLHSFAQLTPTSGNTFAAGVKFGPDGYLYAAVASFNPADHAAAVWRIAADGSAAEVAHLDDAGFPNDLAFDDAGDIFVTDPFLGRIWKIAPTGAASVWLADPSLLGEVASGSALDGPSSLVFGQHGADKKNLYISNFAISSAFGTPLGHHNPPAPGLLRLPVQHHGASIP
jgi:sugar lactone lactonase YvrE